MSKVQVDKVVNLSDDGAPQLTYGAELPVGYGLTGAGGLNISGVVTAASAVFSGNVTIGGTLTYEDVTNIDSVGIVTARNGLKVLAGGANVVGVVTATSFNGPANQITVADESSDTTCFPTFVTAAMGGLSPKTGTNLTFNSATGQLTATSYAGDGSGLSGIVAGIRKLLRLCLRNKYS